MDYKDQFQDSIRFGSVRKIKSQIDVFPDASDIKLISINAQSFKLLKSRLLFYVRLKTRSPGPLLRKRIEPRSYCFISTVNLQLICMRAFQNISIVE